MMRMRNAVSLAILTAVGVIGFVSSEAAIADSVDWQKLTPATMPEGREVHAMIYDNIRKVAVLFAGHTSASSDDQPADTWEFDGTDWSMKSPAASPLFRQGHAMAFDSNRGRTVLFGGFHGADVNGSYVTYLGDTWEWDGSNWTENAVSGPSVRYLTAMVYDSNRGISVLFGGDRKDCGCPGGDTWEWNGTAWTERSLPASPPRRARHAMAYDSARKVVVLFGGWDSTSPSKTPLNDTWEYDGNTWTQRTPANSPSGRLYHSMAYDSARGVTVLFGGELNCPNCSGISGKATDDTWEWDGNNWTQRTPATKPLARHESAMVFDSTNNRCLLFGGDIGNNSADGSFSERKETWIYAPGLNGGGNGGGGGGAGSSPCGAFGVGFAALAPLALVGMKRRNGVRKVRRR